MSHLPTELMEQDPPTYSLSIVERADLSLADLARMVAAGDSLVRSPHVGNWSLYNCAVAATGARMVVYDRTTPHHDANYFPGYQLLGTAATNMIAKPTDQRMVTHLVTDRQSGDVAKCTPLVEAHMSSLRAALPHARLETMSDYLARHADAVQEVVSCLLAHGFDAGWTRRVDENGAVLSIKGALADNLREHGIFRSGTGSSETSGALQPNAYNVLLFAVLEALDHNTNVVTHLSGPDMINYVHDMADDLSAMYNTVATHTSLGDRLPRALTFQIVPTAYARFVAPSDRSEELDALLGAQQRWTEAVAQKQPGWEERARLGRLAVEAAARRYLDPVAALGNPNYLSQYDVRAAAANRHDSGLYIPDAVWRTPFAELGSRLASLRDLIS